MSYLEEELLYSLWNGSVIPVEVVFHPTKGSHEVILVRILIYLRDSLWLDEKQPLPVSHFHSTMNTGILLLGRT